MRQTGILGAAGLYAVDHNIERLAEDHTNARLLAEGISEISLFSVDVSEVLTNIVYFDVSETTTVGDVLDTLQQEDIYMVQTGPRTIRAVTHLDVASEDIHQTLRVLHHRFGSRVIAT